VNVWVHPTSKASCHLILTSISVITTCYSLERDCVGFWSVGSSSEELRPRLRSKNELQLITLENAASLSAGKVLGLGRLQLKPR
jgi:hypothetical protein